MMRTEAPFREVVEAVRAHMATCESGWEEAGWQLFHQIAADLDVTMDERATGAAKNAQERLHGQVRRALNLLADEGGLVKDSDGYRAVFMTPLEAGRRQRVRAAAAVRAQEADERRIAEQARADAVIGRLAELGITAHSAARRLSDGMPGVTLSVDDASLVAAVLAWAQPGMTGERGPGRAGTFVALRRSARHAHDAGKLTDSDLEDRLDRIAFMERQDQ
jgi:hypothetical protein